MTTHGPDSSVETIGATLPAHENAPDDPPNPWADAAKALRRRIAESVHRLDNLDLPTPGSADEVDVIAMKPLARALEVAAARYDKFQEYRRERSAVERQARKA